jgi:hypothetical protein
MEKEQDSSEVVLPLLHCGRPQNGNTTLSCDSAVEFYSASPLDTADGLPVD